MSFHDRALWMSALKFGTERVGLSGAGLTDSRIEIMPIPLAQAGAAR
jgi:hypothetical protein